MRVPVVALASMGRFAGLLAEIETLGRILGREERAAALVSYFRTRLDEAGAAGPDVPGPRPSVYLSFWGSLVRTPVSYEPVEAAGGRNVASGLLPDLSRHGRRDGLPREDPRLGPRRHPRPGELSAGRTAGDGRGGPPGPPAGLPPGRADRPRPLHVRLLVLVGPGPRPGRDALSRPPLRSGGVRRTGPRPDGERDLQGDSTASKGLFSALCRVLKCHEWTTR